MYCLLILIQNTMNIYIGVFFIIKIDYKFLYSYCLVKKYL